MRDIEPRLPANSCAVFSGNIRWWWSVCGSEWKTRRNLKMVSSRCECGPTLEYSWKAAHELLEGLQERTEITTRKPKHFSLFFRGNLAIVVSAVEYARNTLKGESEPSERGNGEGEDNRRHSAHYHLIRITPTYPSLYRISIGLFAGTRRNANVLCSMDHTCIKLSYHSLRLVPIEFRNGSVMKRFQVKQ